MNLSKCISIAVALHCSILTSCGLFHKRPQPAAATSTQAAQSTLPTVPTTPHQTEPATAPTKTSRWVFRIDESQSKGTIDLSLDPKGSLLGAKPARSTTELRGTIHADVITFPDGSQQMKITDLSLRNVHMMVMPFHWSRLVGSIGVTIHPQVLKISDHSLPAHHIAMGRKRFDIQGCHFTVGGTAKVTGSGLVLKKAVGNRTVDLTIGKTEPVTLNGKFHTHGNTTTLTIPHAVMRDQFDMEGTLLKLKFTSNITATAVAR